MARARSPKAPAAAARLRLRLYVAGSAPNSVNAIANARALCDEHFAAGHDIEVVDLIKQPDRAIADGVIVTPTLIKLAPPPQLRLVGDLGDQTRVLTALSGK